MRQKVGAHRHPSYDTRLADDLWTTSVELTELRL
jgi:hypothetical protein